MLIPNVTAKTMAVRLIASRRVGQFTFFELATRLTEVTHNRIWLATLKTFFCFCHIDLQVKYLRTKRRLERRRCFLQGRPGRTRTHNRSFWRRELYQIELLACVRHRDEHAMGNIASPRRNWTISSRDVKCAAGSEGKTFSIRSARDRCGGFSALYSCVPCTLCTPS